MELRLMIGELTTMAGRRMRFVCRSRFYFLLTLNHHDHRLNLKYILMDVIAFREALRAKLISSGVLGTDAYVVVAGPANTYAHYVTTPEEYAAQRYEGASTIFGKCQRLILLQFSSRNKRSDDTFPQGPLTHILISIRTWLNYWRTMQLEDLNQTKPPMTKLRKPFRYRSVDRSISLVYCFSLAL